MGSLTVPVCPLFCPTRSREVRKDVLRITVTAPPKGYAMNDEKKLSDDDLKDIAGGIKNYNSSKSNTSFGVDDNKDGDPNKGEISKGTPGK